MSKIIITGATGRIGSACLARCLSHPAVHLIVALTRRPIDSPEAGNPKLKNLIVSDFSTLSEDVLAELEGANACIWSLGQNSEGDPQMEEREHVWPMAAARLFAEKLAPLSTPTPFRFVLMSGQFVLHSNADPNASLWFFTQARKTKGRTSRAIIGMQGKFPNFESFAVRPGGVITDDNWTPNLVVAALSLIRRGDLAAAVVDIALNGGQQRLFECGELRSKGIQEREELLATSPTKL
ncbi:hypothetical protein B0H17DRAFT_1063191 [Mycena rosella]|uniref:NAD(P)-binding domain-containing protein n=1 Tax=Mycena rosella TaxID=1033263 RepID=A0AAD7GEP6_MYCRO|nr:hypothetical protein B0H17DRAFT_1063191 [Mycena rosella]